MGVGGFCVIFVGFVNFVCFNGSVVIFLCALWLCCGFVIFLSRWCCALVARMDLFCDLCLWCVCFSVCICVMNCGGPVWADLWCVYYMWFWLWFSWLTESGCLCAFDLVEFVCYNFIIIYCYLGYK